METISMKYGEDTVEIPLAGAKSVTTLREKEIPAIGDLAAAFFKAVTAEAIDSPPLGECISSTDKVTIVISDLTRFWMRQDLICKQLLDFLHDRCGVPDDNIAILIALGTHRPQTEAELRKLTSDAVFERVTVKNHDCMATDLRHVGTTTRGTEVYVNPLAVGRKVILVGGTMHHLMAGFGGGRKSILPGICGKSTINQNHVHSLSPFEARSNPLIGMGILPDNPVHEDMDEAAEMVAPVFGINIVVNSKNAHCRLLCGHWRAAFAESCRVVQDAMGVPIPRKADAVVVSCGGYPKDINLYQAVKSLLNAAQALKDGGTLVFLAECREGGGAAEFFDWIEPLRRGTLDRDLRADFSIAGYIFYACCEVIARFDVHILTKISSETVADMGMRGYDNVEALLQGVDFTGKDVFLMPFGGYIVPFLEEI